MNNYKKYLMNIKNSFKGYFNRSLKVISTFNGIGSTSESLRQLGIDIEIDTVCEINESVNNTFFSNFEVSRDKLVEDIEQLEKDIEVGKKVDILIQTPPCQSFSNQGKKDGLNSKNGNLFLTSINLQKKVDSSIVVYENVKGLISNDKKIGKYKSLMNSEYDGKKKSIGHTLHTIEKLLLEDTRYNYYWNVLNSCEQGLPQNRERVFIVGIKKELDNETFSFPKNKDLEYTVEDVLEIKPVNNVYYKNSNNHKLNIENQKRRKNKIHTYGKYDETMTFESTRRVSYPYVSPCITTGNNCKFFIDGKVRVLSSTELKKVHGFSDDFKFVGTKTQIHKQLGNTVSPGVYVNLFREIFKSVNLMVPVNNVHYKPNKSGTIKYNHTIEITRKVVYKNDSNYIYLKKEVFQEYEEHIRNGGTINLSVEFYNSKEDKKIGKIHTKKTIRVQTIKLLSLVNKKYGFYRVKVYGISNIIQSSEFKLEDIKSLYSNTYVSNNIDYIPITKDIKIYENIV